MRVNRYVIGVNSKVKLLSQTKGQSQISMLSDLDAFLQNFQQKYLRVKNSLPNCRQNKDPYFWYHKVCHKVCDTVKIFSLWQCQKVCDTLCDTRNMEPYLGIGSLRCCTSIVQICGYLLSAIHFTLLSQLSGYDKFETSKLPSTLLLY